MALICRSCGTALPEEAQFCMKCAAPTTDATKVGGSLVPAAMRRSSQSGRREVNAEPERHFDEPLELPRLNRRDNPRRSSGTGFRIAAMIVSLILMVIVGAQSCFGVVVGGIAQNEGIAQGSSVGVLVAFLFLVGGALVLAAPMFSFVIFLIAGASGVLAGTTTPYRDLAVWGVIAVGLALLSFLGRGSPGGHRRDAEFAQRSPYLVAGGIVLVVAMILIAEPHGTPQSTGSTAIAVPTSQSTVALPALTMTPSPASGPLGSAANPYPITAEVVVGDVKWKIIQVETPSNLPQLCGTSKRPQGKFVVVDAQVENLAKEMKSVTDLNLVDNQGRKFTAAPGPFVIQPPQVMLLQNINPNMPYQYSTVFDIPADATGLSVTVSDLSTLGAKLAYISLGGRGSH